MSWAYGTVKRFSSDDRFGFIAQDEHGEPDVFFHENDLDASGYPKKGDRVRYRLRWSRRKERYSAVDVQLLHEMRSSPATSHRESVEPTPDREQETAHMQPRGFKRIKTEHRDNDMSDHDESATEEMLRLLREIHSTVCR